MNLGRRIILKKKKERAAMNERPPLLQSLRDDFVRFQSRNTVGGMRTEHSIFIPSELLKDKAEETDQFIRAAIVTGKQIGRAHV